MPRAAGAEHRDEWFGPMDTPVLRARRSRRRVVLYVLAAVVVALAVWTIVVGIVAEHRLQAVRADISQLTRQTALDRASLERDLTRDLRSVRSAESLLRQPGPRVVGWIPIVGRNVHAEQTVSGASAAALQAGLTLARATDGLDDGQGGVDVARLRTAGQDLARAATSLRPSLDRLAALSVGWTLPQTQDGVRLARNQLLGLDDRLARGAKGLEAISGVLGGSGRRTVLVGLMNNAELRGAGGLLSAYALGTTDQGHLSLHGFRDVNLVAQPPKRAVTVPAPAEYESTYGAYLANSTLWKNITMSPQGADTAAVLSAVAAVSLHVRPSVVVLCDVPAAADIISATGPVIIDGQSVSGAELTRRLLVDAYGKGSLSNKLQVQRRRALTSAASQAFDRLQRNATATPALLRALLDGVSGRHIIVWSDRPSEEQELIDAQVAGTVDATGSDIVMAVTNNLGDRPSQGNKLDYYVHRDVTVDARLRPGSATVTQTVTFHNEAPDHLGPYVQGVAHPGKINELLSFDVGASANLTSFTQDGAAQPVHVTQADGAQRLTTVLQLPRGDSTTYRLRYQLPLPHGVYRLLLVPQALARPATLTLDISAVDAELGVATGIDQPRDDRIEMSGPWNSTKDVAIPVHSLTGLRGIFHDIAHFWTHKVSL